VRRVPLLTGTRVVLVEAPDDAVVLRPPAPGEAIADVGAAVRDALRFPLAGRPLEALATRGGRATIVVEPPALPIPSSAADPRREAIVAASDELARTGIAPERQTLLVAGGLARRLEQQGREALVPPGFARRFHGRVEVHDAESPDLLELPGRDGRPRRVNRALVDTDLVLVVSAAETVLHGGPAALLAASDPATQRTAGAGSLVETSGSSGWAAAVDLEAALGQRVVLVGVSLALNHPRLAGFLQGYPYEPGALERVAGSPLRALFGLLPSPVRTHVLQSLRCDITVAAAYSGPPSVAHAEALLRAIEARAAALEGELDAVCIAIPRLTPYLPRERPNPLLAAYLGLGYALRLWRDAFPLVRGGTAILLHGFERRFSHPTQQPYRAFFAATRSGRDPDALAAAEQAATTDERALNAYRSGRTCHPLLPFADWDACQPALDRLGTVLVAGCRDAAAARQLGFVPTHGIGAALAMTHGQAGGEARVGFLLAPPFFPIEVTRAPRPRG
jgi:hypothetical protein